MSENNLRSQAMKKIKVQTTNSNYDFPIAPNWINQHLTCVRNLMRFG
ncbi:hypothetical protein SAMN05518855_1004237 [Paenibacillus sp. CF384]|nr:hypothetical protein SAMN05518855_1004237 [Paenibacillus sp. CF384]